MTSFERQQLSEWTDQALSNKAAYGREDGPGYLWDTKVVVDPRILRELLDATEERTVARLGRDAADG